MPQSNPESSFWALLHGTARSEAGSQHVRDFPFLKQHRSAAARKFLSVLRTFPRQSLPRLVQLLVDNLFARTIPALGEQTGPEDRQLLEQVRLRSQCVAKRELDRLAAAPTLHLQIHDATTLDASHRQAHLSLAPRSQLRRLLLAKLRELGPEIVTKGSEMAEETIAVGAYKVEMIMDFGGWTQLRIDTSVRREDGSACLTLISYPQLLGYPLSGWDEITNDELESSVRTACDEFERLRIIVTNALSQALGAPGA